MKNLLFAFVFLPFCAFSQVEKWEYLSVDLTTYSGDSETIALVDDGSKVKKYKLFKTPEYLSDSTGNIVFKSPVDALNFFGSDGWEVVYFDKRVGKEGLSEHASIRFKRRKK